jgi:ribosome-associated toxin RatA of RatAB toxin-antitoxin module
MSVTQIKRSALLPYTAKEMFELVDAIEHYPTFLPWCTASQIISRKDNEVEATLELSWSGMHKSFTTKNTLIPYERIDINLIQGPFKHLEGIWTFTPMGDHGCKVNLELDFELVGHFLDVIFQPIFSHIANSLVDLFTKRAVEVYGQRKED